MILNDSIFVGLSQDATRSVRKSASACTTSTASTTAWKCCSSTRHWLISRRPGATRGSSATRIGPWATAASASPGEESSHHSLRQSKHGTTKKKTTITTQVRARVQTSREFEIRLSAVKEKMTAIKCSLPLLFKFISCRLTS